MNNKTPENTLLIFPKKTARTACETFSRSMGYIRPIKNFNIGKRAEFEERNTFKEANALSTGDRHRDLLKKAA